ncbi:GIP [Symbiodinium sp. CCMP2456]|nr:GIP [Symbiodinium sp. CCMP2456]
MLAASGYVDTSIASEIGRGFDLTGPIPSSGGLFKPVVEPATMSKECLRAAAPAVRAGILQATARACTSELAQEVHDLTQDEVKRGWLAGPIPLERLSQTTSVSRRFGVVQSSGGRRKVRPIDNLSESFINSTVSRVESIQPHGLDVVCAAIAHRLRVRERAGKATVPMLKIIDLLKAYKQLGISSDALQDAFLSVPNPETGAPNVYECLVLPFGAAASVAAFCRTTMSLWHLGCALLLLHWTVFYDDFIVVNEKSSAKHCELVLSSFWSLLGWSVSRDKETEFAYFARALGVKICFQSERMFVVENTQERKDELNETITDLLSAQWVDQHALASLRGRLQFVEGQIHGRRCHRHMRVLSLRAEFIGGSAVDDDLCEAAKSAFIAARTPSAQFGALLEWLACWEEKHSTFPWFERVSSAANIADGPSRDNFGLLKGVQRDDCDLAMLILELQCGMPELATASGITASSVSW